MIRENLQRHLDKKYPDMHLTISSPAFTENPAVYVIGHIGYNFAAYPTETVDQRLLIALEDTKRLVESSIEKVKINLGKPEKILGVDVIRVDDEYWANAEALWNIYDMMKAKKVRGELFHGDRKIVYKPALDK